LINNDYIAIQGNLRRHKQSRQHGIVKLCCVETIWNSYDGDIAKFFGKFEIRQCGGALPEWLTPFYKKWFKKLFPY